MTSGEEPAFRSVLHGWPELAGFPEPPPDIGDARAAFKRGAAAHARGARAEAQAEFLRAAALLPDVPGPYADSLETMRNIARKNAEAASAPAA